MEIVKESSGLDFQCEKIVFYFDTIVIANIQLCPNIGNSCVLGCIDGDCQSQIADCELRFSL